MPNSNYSNKDFSDSVRDVIDAYTNYKKNKYARLNHYLVSNGLVKNARESEVWHDEFECFQECADTLHTLLLEIPNNLNKNSKHRAGFTRKDLYNVSVGNIEDPSRFYIASIVLALHLRPGKLNTAMKIYEKAGYYLTENQFCEDIIVRFVIEHFYDFLGDPGNNGNRYFSNERLKSFLDEHEIFSIGNNEYIRFTSSISDAEELTKRLKDGCKYSCYEPLYKRIEPNIDHIRNFSGYASGLFKQLSDSKEWGEFDDPNFFSLLTDSTLKSFAGNKAIPNRFHLMCMAIALCLDEFGSQELFNLGGAYLTEDQYKEDILLRFMIKNSSSLDNVYARMVFMKHFNFYYKDKKDDLEGLVIESWDEAIQYADSFNKSREF